MYGLKQAPRAGAKLKIFIRDSTQFSTVYAYNVSDTPIKVLAGMRQFGQFSS